MPVDLDDQLAALGAELMRDSAPITLHELGRGDMILRRSDTATRPAPVRRRWAAAVAIATGAAAVVGIVAIDPSNGGSDLATGPQPAEPASNGVLLPDAATADGWAFQSATAGRDPSDGTRIVYYSTQSATPDRAPSLVLSTPVPTYGPSDAPPSATPNAAPITVYDAHAWWWATSELDLSIVFAVDGIGYRIDGHNVTADQLRMAAEHVRPVDDEEGARLDQAGMPIGVAERAVGTVIESWFFDQAAVQRDLPQLSWRDGAGRPMWMTVARSDVDLVALARIGRSSVTDVEVRGGAGIALQDHGDEAFRSLVWSERGATYFLGARDVSIDEMRAFAAALRPATADEWAALVDEEPLETVDIPAPTVVPTTTVVERPAPGRMLTNGMDGDDVGALQERLVALGFDPGPSDGVYGTMTEQAVWAFEKLVMRVPREQATGSVTPEVWERIGSEVLIAPRRPQGVGVDHVEIYLPEQVMVVFRSDEPMLITHVSTGALDESGDPAAWCETLTVDTDGAGMALHEPDEMTICGRSKTPGGVFEADRLVTGIRLGPLGAMFDPIYFNRGIAIHGGLNVPLHPVTKGSVRVPMHIAEYLHDLIPVGTTIFVWDGVKEPEEQTPADEMPVFDSVQPGIAVP